MFVAIPTSFFVAGRRESAASVLGFTLAEVVIALAIAALSLGGIIYGYIESANRAEWAGYSLAAQSLGVQRLEQTRACKWDPLGFPATDELVGGNFPVDVEILDIPISGTNLVYATNTTAIKTISVNPSLRMIRVDCTWTFRGRGVFTNTVATYRAPDQ
ncbi:MAG: type IV pilus modification PilV family protein [Limisphaerales bacterium]